MGVTSSPQMSNSSPSVSGSGSASALPFRSGLANPAANSSACRFALTHSRCPSDRVSLRPFSRHSSWCRPVFGSGKTRTRFRPHSTHRASLRLGSPGNPGHDRARRTAFQAGRTVGWQGAAVQYHHDNSVTDYRQRSCRGRPDYQLDGRELIAKAILPPASSLNKIRIGALVGRTRDGPKPPRCLRNLGGRIWNEEAVGGWSRTTV